MNIDYSTAFLLFRKFAKRLVKDAKTTVILYCEEDGSCPFLEWLAAILSHGNIKERAIPLKEIERAMETQETILRRIRRSIATGRCHDQEDLRPPLTLLRSLTGGSIKDKPDRIKSLEEVRANDEIARKIIDGKLHVAFPRRLDRQGRGFTCRHRKPARK